MVGAVSTIAESCRRRAQDRGTHGDELAGLQNLEKRVDGCQMLLAVLTHKGADQLPQR